MPTLAPVLAHAGHWLISLSMVAPVLAMAAAVLVAALVARRREPSHQGEET